MLLERGALLGALGQRLDEAMERSGSLVLVAGEAGAGKTSLISAFVDSLGDSAQVVEGACDPLTTPRPLSPLHDFAADPNFELVIPTGDDRAVLETFTDLLDRLKNPVRPIVMVVEDIHWADEGTLDFVRFVGRRVAACTAVVVCTYRDDEVGPDHPLRPVLGQLTALRSTHRIVVPPLTIDAVTSLTAGTTIEPADLLGLTDGNPFFVTEILASGSDLPATVQEAVLARVARLATTARRVVEAVSVAPRSLQVMHAVTIAGASLDDVDAALDAGVVIGDRLGLRFRHELARSAVEESLPVARRMGFHLDMLRILEQEADPDVARLAHHAMRAAAAELIVEYAPRAARLAASNGSHKQAVSFIEAALAHADRIDDDDEAALRLLLADELGTVDRRLDALDQVDLAAQHYRTIGDELSLAETLVPHTGGEVGFWMWRLGAIDGQPEGAAEPYALQISGAWDEANAVWRDIGCPYEAATALADGSADARLEALGIFTTLGARPMADRMRGELRAAGVDHIPRGPTRTTRDNPAGLTTRQLEVLQLLADGLTNGEIADRLFVSKKTVEHHVSAIYMKLGVTSRSRAALEAERIGSEGFSV